MQKLLSIKDMLYVEGGAWGYYISTSLNVDRFWLFCLAAKYVLLLNNYASVRYLTYD